MNKNVDSFTPVPKKGFYLSKKNMNMIYVSDESLLILRKLCWAFDVSTIDVLEYAFKEVNKITSADALIHTDSIPDGFIDELYKSSSSITYL